MKNSVWLIVLAFLLSNASASPLWELVNKGIEGEMILCLATKDSLIFAGSWSGAFVSSDNGESREKIQDNFNDGSVSCFAIVGENIYIGTQCVGIFLSTDNGVHWNAMNNGLPGHCCVNSIVHIGNYLFEGDGDYGASLSTDNGENWNSRGLSYKHVVDMAVKGDTIFAAAILLSCGEERGLYRSIDKGKNWVFVSSGDLFSYGFYNYITVNDDYIFVGNGMGVYKSADGGDNWICVNNGMQYTNIEKLVTIENNIIAGTRQKIYLSTNNGTSWKDCTSFLDVDVPFISFTYKTPYVFISISSHGIYRAKLYDLITSVNDEKEKQKSTFLVYPNPSNHRITVVLSGNIENETINLYTLDGKLIKNLFKGKIELPEQTLYLQTDNVPPGVYFIKRESTQETEKIIIE